MLPCTRPWSISSKSVWTWIPMSDLSLVWHSQIIIIYRHFGAHYIVITNRNRKLKIYKALLETKSRQRLNGERYVKPECLLQRLWIMKSMEILFSELFKYTPCSKWSGGVLQQIIGSPGHHSQKIISERKRSWLLQKWFAVLVSSLSFSFVLVFRNAICWTLN